MSKSHLTKHGIKRARQRVGSRKDRVQQLADEAWELGLHQHKAKGRLRKYLDKILLSGGSADRVVVYKDRVFLYHGLTFLTVWGLPHNLRKKKKNRRAKIESAGWRSVEKKPKSELKKAVRRVEGVTFEDEESFTFKMIEIDPPDKR